MQKWSWVMRSIILLLDVWWRGSPVTPRRLEKLCWKIAGVTRFTSYRAPGIVCCRRCLAWSIARGTRTSSPCLTLKHFIQMTIDDWTTSKVSRNEGPWNFHDFCMRPSNRWLDELMADGWTRFEIDFRCSRIPIGMIPPFTFPLWNFS